MDTLPKSLPTELAFLQKQFDSQLHVHDVSLRCEFNAALFEAVSKINDRFDSYFRLVYWFAVVIILALIALLAKAG